MSDPCVAIVTPMYGHPHPIFAWDRMHLRRPGTKNGDFPGVSHLSEIRDYPVEMARTELTARMLAATPRVTHILWIDADMTFPPDALERLLKHDLPIVGGLCHNRRGPSYHPILARKPDPSLGFPPQHYAFFYDYTPGELVDVDATGGAFLLVKREVFDAISEKFGAESWWQPGFGHRSMSEDFSFCARAKECGFSIKVDTSLEIGHIAEVVIRSEEARRLRTMPWGRWIPADVERKDGAPRATIVIPTFNQNHRYLKAAVQSALAQTVPVEVIVVDDGSDTPVVEKWGGNYKAGWGVDGSNVYPADEWETVSMPEGVRVIRHDRNRGISAALNTGIKAATTDWICWLSSDDLLTHDKVEKQLERTLAASCKVSFTRYETIRNDDHDLFARYPLINTWATQAEQNAILAEVCAINGSTSMIHRSVFEDVGFFDESLRYGQDWLMWRKIGAKYRWLLIDEPLGIRREGENLTARIAVDPEKKRRRDEEDAIVRAWRPA